MSSMKRVSLPLFFFFLLVSFSYSSQAQTSINATHKEDFLQCFLSHSLPSQLLATPADPSYAADLRSAAQNIRFLSSTAVAKPALIVTPTTAAHVQASVLCCRATGLGLRVRSGGHDYEGMSYVSEDPQQPFALLDLTNLRTISVDAVHGTAWVGAGATVGELYYAVATANRTAAFPAGICPTIGVGGHFSGGGIGTITRKYGTAADNVIDAQLVDAAGRVLDRASMGEDLFWAIRGGGAASFGVVLAYKVNLVAVPPTVTAFNVVKTLSQNATQLVQRWQEVAPKLDDDLFIRVVAQAIDDGRGGRTIQATFNSLYLGTCKDLLVVMAKSFPELGLGSNYCNEMSWLETFLFFNSITGRGVDALLDRTPLNISFKGKSDFVTKPISQQGLESVWKFLTDAQDELLIMIMDPMGGRMDDIASTAIAFPHRKGNLYNIQYYLPWTGTDATAAARHVEWMRKLYAFMVPLVSSGPRAAYYNYKDIDLGRNGNGSAAANYAAAARGWGAAYFKGNLRRLAAVKEKVDPQNFFRNEQSIPPLIAK